MHRFVLLLAFPCLTTWALLQRPVTVISPGFFAPIQSDLRLEVDIVMNSLDLLILFQPIRSQLPSNTTLLESTEWNTIMSHHVMITPYCSRIYCCGNSQSLSVILGKYSCAETVYGRVC